MNVILPYLGIVITCFVAIVYRIKFSKNRKSENIVIYIFILLFSALIGGIVAVWEQYKVSGAQGEDYLSRNPAGEGEYSAYFEIDAADVLEKYPMEVLVAEQNMTGKEVWEIFEKAGKELEETILGENESAENVMYDLHPPSTLQEGLVSVSCTFDNYKIIDPDGSILQENMKENSYPIKVTAELYFQGQEAIHEFFLQVVPKELDEQEKLLKGLSTALEKENNRAGQEWIKLPEQINGYKVAWYPANEELHIKIFCLGILVIPLFYLYKKKQAEQMQKERDMKLSIDYPDIVSQLSLLVGAGMTIGSAWEKIAVKYQTQRDEIRKIPEKNRYRPGYEEMLKTLHEMQDGIGETKAYERFGFRCGQSTYRKLSSLLIQNVRKGPKGMQELLDGEVRDAFTQRKLLAKKLGEEAGTKLLIPMGLMLMLVFIILLVPAMLSLQL